VSHPGPVVVVGGGPAGSVAALTLARAGRRVLLLERAPAAATFRIGEGLPPAAKPLLKALGVWPRFCAQNHLPSHGNASRWGGDDIAVTDFLRSPYGHGWHLDRAAFDAGLLDAAVEAGVELRRGASLSAVTPEGGRWHLDYIAQGAKHRLAAAALVDATGRNGLLARRLGAERVVHDRLVAWFQRWRTPPHDVDSRSLVEAATDGWWYSALLPRGERVVVYFTDFDDESAQHARSPEGFLSLLARTAWLQRGLREAGAEPLDAPQSAAAGGAWLRRPAGPGWVAVGDAAAAFDPLSSQGLLTAMSGARQGAHALLAALDGDEAARSAYEAWLEATVAAYRREHTRHYALEARWAERPFWRRRREPGVAPGAPLPTG
jgi:flavin-dependent dehydrogenase